MNTNRSLLLLLMCLALLMADCTQHAPQALPEKVKQPPAEEYKTYFPAAVLRDQKQALQEFEINWYVKHFRAMQEPSLATLKSDSLECYRFTFLPMFSFPLSIRLEKKKNDSSFVMYAKSVEYVKNQKSGSYEPGALKLNLMKKFSRFYFRQWKELQAALEANRFHQSGGSLPKMGYVGNLYIVEGVKDGKYSLLAKSAPQEDSFQAGREFIELCDFFTTLAVVDKNEVSF